MIERTLALLLGLCGIALGVVVALGALAWTMGKRMDDVEGRP
jgi:hypothetical protein